MKEKIFTILPKEFKIETSRSGGKGGQNVQKRDTKVVIRHLASGAISQCQDERTQEQNKKIAFRRLVDSPKFKLWVKMEAAAKQLGYQDLERKLEDSLKPQNLKIEHLLTYKCDAPGCKKEAQVATPEGQISLPLGWREISEKHSCSQKCYEKLEKKHED